MPSLEQKRLDRLEQELAGAKRRFRALVVALAGTLLVVLTRFGMSDGKFVALVAMATVVGTVLAWVWDGSLQVSQTQETDDNQHIVRANAFILEDNEGRVRGSLEVTEAGLWGLFLTDETNTLQAALAAAEGGAGLNLYDGTGELRALLDVSKDRPVLLLNDKSGKSRVRVDVTDGGPRVGLFDKDGEQRAALGVTRLGSVLNFFDEAGETRTALQWTSAGPRLSMSDESGELVWSVPD